MNSWECKIVFRPDWLAHAVYMTRDNGQDREYLTGTGTQHTIIRAGRHEAVKDDPVFAVLDDDMIHALGAAINEAGYRVPNEHLIEGKLTATERHLDDMRALVFKKK